MMYPPRIEVPGGFYHVCTRGNNKRAIFVNDADRRLFLAILRHVAKLHRWTIFAYCLMTNHYHLLLQLTQGGLSAGMCRLNSGYAAAFNVDHDQSDHVFGRRFWSDLIDHDSHLLASCRYIALNPVRANLVQDVAEWRWSSYRACAGHEFAPAFLAAGELLELFGGAPAAARDAYRRYVSEGHGLCQPPWEEPAARVTSRSTRGPSRLLVG
jgi:putative transposase